MLYNMLLTATEGPAVAAAPTMQDLIDAISAVIGAIVTWFGTVAEAAISNPVLILFMVAIPVVSLVFGLVMRVVGRRGRRR